MPSRTHRRIDDPRFDGASIIMVLFCVCCFIAGVAIGHCL